MNDSEPSTAPPVDLRREYAQAMRKCTPKQRRWLREVVTRAGMTESARAHLGYSKHTVWKWLRDPQVQRVRELQAQLAELDSELTRERIIREYNRLAFSDLRSLYDENGNVKPPHLWTDDAAAAVQEYSFDAQGRPKIKLHSKPHPLDTAARIRRVLVDRHEHTGANGQPLQPPVIAITFPDGGPGAAAATEDGVETS